MPTLLIIDDEPGLLYSLRAGLESDDLAVDTARTARQGLERIRQSPPDAVLLDVRLPDRSGLDAFDDIRALDPKLPVVVITAFAAAETAIEAMKRGAVEYLLKPVDLHHLREVVAKAVDLRRMRQVPALIGPEDQDSGQLVDRIVGRSASVQEVCKAIGRVAAQNVTVLIRGESGTGKELVARAIYQHSDRADKPFLAINCAAIPETLLESELFGHERGAFTGADRRRIGKFEQAHGGTLFLDEVGDMVPAVQAKVLRLLQDQQFERLGGGETIAADVRVVAATNQPLEELVAAGRFRQDLFYRLTGFPIVLTPLRERIDDVPLLAEHFLRQCSRQLGKAVTSIDPDAMRLMQAHTWPGNVRELQSAVRFAVLHTAGDVLTPDCLPAAVRGTEAVPTPITPTVIPAPIRTPPATGPRLDVSALVEELLRTKPGDVYRQVAEAVDRIVLEAALRFAAGSQVQASEVLGISRTTLRAKLHALGLTVEKQVRAGDADGPGPA